MQIVWDRVVQTRKGVNDELIYWGFVVFTAIILFLVFMMILVPLVEDYEILNMIFEAIMNIIKFFR